MTVQVEQCEEVALFLKPRLANLARSCMLGLSEVAICGPLNLTDCILEALEQSCPDPSALPVCEEVAAECGGDVQGCQSIIGGLTAAGREELLDCVLPQFCDFDSCMEGLGLFD
jgi:hypothetical protein